MHEAQNDMDEAPNDMDEASNDMDESPNDMDEAPNDMDEAPNDMNEVSNDMDEAQNDMDEASNDMDEAQNDMDEAQNDMDKAPNDMDEAPNTGNGFADISWNDIDIKTPHLDGLAKDGVILDWNYMQPACTPSRASLMTGKYPFRMGLQHRVFLEGSPECVPLKEKFLPEALKDLGYATHMVGKWHLGMCNWDCTPTYRGFDTFYGFYSGFVHHYTHDVAGGYDWRDQEKIDTCNNGTYATDLISERTLDIIRNHKSSKPLFMYVSHAATHQPFQAKPEYIGIYPNEKDEERLGYLGLLTAMDESVGELVQTLKDSGLYDNTIIIFSSDNGGEAGPANNHPLRGAKASSFEGGTRSAAMVHSPLLNKKNYRHEGIVHVSDWFPTLVSLAGGSTEGLDGLDLSTMLLSGAPSPRVEMVYNVDQINFALYGKAVIRQGDYKMFIGFPGLYDGWEEETVGLTHQVDILGVNSEQTQKSSRAKRSSYTFDFATIGTYANKIDDRVQLFNLKDDPSEKHNIADQHPDVVSRLQARLEELLQEAAPVDLANMAVVDRGLPHNWGGFWSPGWC